MGLLHISTDKPRYIWKEDVIVTATVDGWCAGPGGKIRLVIWIPQNHQHIADQYFTKPTNSDTVKWTVPADTFFPYLGNLFDAQLEFGTLHADAKFYY